MTFSVVKELLMVGTLGINPPESRLVRGICPHGDHTFSRRRHKNEAGRFCSREHERAWRAARATWAPRLRIAYLRACADCPTFFWSAAATQRRCRNCAPGRWRAYYAARKPLVARACRECRVSFTPEYGNRRRVFCSQACLDRLNSRVGKALRRARHRAVVREAFDPREIYDRDGWRCGLCRRRVLQRVQVPHPKAATLDHIVPLTEGGAHTRANVQLAHFGCNARKGERACGSQLRLVG